MWLITSMLFVIHGSEAPFKAFVTPPKLTVDEVITKWKAASKAAGERNGTFRVIEYDRVFLTEKRGVGSFKLPSTESWEFSIQPDPEVIEGLEHQHGTITYLLSRYAPESYSFCDGTIVETTVHGTQKYIFEDYEIDLGPFLPKIDLMEIIEPYRMLMLPHLCGENFKEWKIEYSHDPKADYHLILSPVTPDLKKSLGKIEVILSNEFFLTEAVKFHSPCGHRQHVYLVQYDRAK